MKTYFYTISVVLEVLCICNNAGAQTNKSLSNLTAPTAINQSLLPNSNNSKDLGSDALGWRNIYLSDHIYINKKRAMTAIGSGNFYIGLNAGQLSSTGSANTATGEFALGKIAAGVSRTANGYSALYNNTNGRDNTSAGYQSMFMNVTGAYNTANGSWSLYSNTTGIHNTAYGYSALWQNQTGNDNTAIGKYAMYSHVTGFSNIAIGTMTLFKSVRNNNTVAIGDSTLYNFTGDLFTYESYTTAVGSKALFNATTGYENTAIGTRALYNTTKGAINTAVGVSAMFSNTEGVFNTAIGVTSLSGNTTGKYNTGIGYSALQINKTGSQNTALGSYAGPNSYDLVSNSTSIGYLARATASNQVWLGNTAVTSIGGQVGWTTFSDGRYKKDIKENVPGLAFINALKPVTYTVDTKNLHAYLNKNINSNNNKIKDAPDEVTVKAIDEAGKIIHDGFVAQEVELAAKKLGFEFSGVDKPKSQEGLYGLRYDNFVVPLVKAVQELSKQNDSLKEQNESLQRRIERLELMMNISSANTSSSLNNVTGTSISLEQNIPNPFTNNTTIGYNIPSKFTTAQIMITNSTGKIVKQLKITSAGSGMLNIDASTLSSGIYTYSLIIDQKTVSTKQMMVSK